MSAAHHTMMKVSKFIMVIAMASIPVTSFAQVDNEDVALVSAHS